MNFKIYTVEKDSEKEYGPKAGDIRVKFYREDGSVFTDHCTELDKDTCQMYFSIPNMIKPRWGESILDAMFVGRIHDAYKAIVQGHGDVIGSTQFFGPLGFKTESVYRFVDREYGEAMRAKTLEGWKDSIFGYKVVFGNNSSMSGPNTITEDDWLYSAFGGDEQSPMRFFETEEDAQAYVNTKMAIAKPLAEEYALLTTDDDRKVFFEKHFPDKGSHQNIIWDLFYALNREHEDSENRFTFEVRQSVK